MNLTETIGLWIILLAVIGFVIGLGTDGFRLWVLKKPTYSQMIWDALHAWRNGYGHFPWGGVLLVVLWSLGVVGLILHLFF